LNKKLYIELIFLVILGAITSFSLPPFNYLIINFFTFSSLFIFLTKKFKQHKNKKLFFIYGWSYGFGYFLTNLYWISISLKFDQNFEFLIPLTVILIPAFLGIFYGLISYFFLILKPKKIISSFFTFTLIFGILEYIRGLILTGFPWNLIAYSFSNQLEILNITSIIGIYGFNLFCVSLFTCPALFLLKDIKKHTGVFLIFLLLILIFYFNGSSNREKFEEAGKQNYDFKLRVVGSNIGIDRFYKDVNTAEIIQELIEISNPIANEKTIFIWPEGIIPNVMQKELSEYAWLFNKRFTENHLLIIGINSQIESNGSKKYYNSLSVFDHQLNILNSYNKINLVPFGEFLPFEDLLRGIGLKSLTNNYQSFSSGDRREIIKIDQKNFLLRILPLICYEIIYSGKLFDNSNFDLIVNISEDGWFGESIGPQQHFAHSIFRAIESGKYIVRSSNNGITAIINPLGNIEKKINFGQSDYIDLQEIKKIQPTIFSIYGNKIFGLLILLYIFLIFSFNKITNE
tara:strand:- start:223 stop:1767 length:1545 start_codon:yes stop_codon:yes gene_type:complete